MNDILNKWKQRHSILVQDYGDGTKLDSCQSEIMRGEMKLMLDIIGDLNEIIKDES